MEDPIPSLGREDPLEKELATHSSILAWRIPWTEELGRLESMGLQRLRHESVTFLSWCLVFALDLACYPMLFFILIFILTALGFSGGIWDLVSWSGIKLGHPALWAWSLSHRTTREVSHAVFYNAFCFINVLVSRSLINMNVVVMESP